MGGFTITIETTEEAKKKAKQSMQTKPVNRPTPQGTEEIGEPIIFDIILDVSGSMNDLKQELVDCFNTIMLKSLKDASERFKGPLRIGCLLFSNKLIPAWEGFKSLKELGTKPLKIDMLNKSGLGGQTALYGAMRSGVLWTAAAREFMYENGEGPAPKGKIIVLTDGANNIPPEDPAIVKRTLREIGKSNAQNIQATIGFFKTDEGLTRSQFETMTRETGFEGCGFYEIAKGAIKAERQRQFRHYFEIFSSDSTC